MTEASPFPVHPAHDIKNGRLVWEPPVLCNMQAKTATAEKNSCSVTDFLLLLFFKKEKKKRRRKEEKKETSRNPPSRMRRRHGHAVYAVRCAPVPCAEPALCRDNPVLCGSVAPVIDCGSALPPRAPARIRYAKECLALLQLRRPVQALDAEIKLAKLF